MLSKQINNILNITNLGFLYFDKNMKIGKSFSKECLRIVQRDDVFQRNISEILFGNDLKTKEIFDYGFQNILQTTDTSTIKLLLSLLPNEHTIGLVTFSIEYKPLENNEYLLIVSDITRQKELEVKIKKEQQMQKMIIAIATHKLESVALIEHFKIFLKDIPQLLQQYQNFEINLITLRRELHTFKGLFAQKEMLHLSNSIHQVETHLEDYLNNPNTKITNIENTIKTTLNEALKLDLKIIDQVLGDDFLNIQPSINVQIRKIDEVKKQIKELIDTADTNTKDSLYRLLANVSSMVNQPLIGMLDIYPNMLKNIASKLDKQINTLQIVGDKNILVSEYFYPFTESLVHIFRNCIDHGIEDIATRELSSKPNYGTIKCSFEKIDNNIKLIISDDGKGIDTDKILQKAVDKNIISQEEASLMNENDILNLIFEDGLSTNKSITSLSGRGIGLNAVMYELKKLNGQVKITNNIGKGITFTFTIPYNQSFQDSKNSDEDIILNYIVDETKAFLINDMKIKTNQIISFKDDDIGKYFATVSLNGDINLFVTMSISLELTNALFDIFVPNMDNENDKTMIMNSLPSEIVNTVVGLSLSKLPIKFKSLVMSEPLALDCSIIKNLKLENDNITKEIQTSKGSLFCTIIKMRS